LFSFKALAASLCPC